MMAGAPPISLCLSALILLLGKGTHQGFSEDLHARLAEYAVTLVTQCLSSLWFGLGSGMSLQNVCVGAMKLLMRNQAA